MKIDNISTFSKVINITTWSKLNGVSGVPFNWSTIYTYTTNATATTITNWIGANISTSPNIPQIINGQNVVVNAGSTFYNKSAFTNCYINNNVTFVSNSMLKAFYNCVNLIGVDLIPNSVTNMSYTFSVLF